MPDSLHDRRVPHGLRDPRFSGHQPNIAKGTGPVQRHRRPGQESLGQNSTSGCIVPSAGYGPQQGAWLLQVPR